MKTKTLFILLSVTTFFGCSLSQPKDHNQNYLVILSMDGFRWDYPNMTATPNLDSIARIGVKAESIRSAFPSKTFPNHYTMAMVLFSDNYTIIRNSYNS